MADAPPSPKDFLSTLLATLPLRPHPPMDLLSTVLTTFPTVSLSSTPGFCKLWVFWSPQRNHPQNPKSIQEKIRYAFDNLEVHDFGGLIQFWAPEKIGCRWLLTTSDQPFALANLEINRYKGLDKYRLCSVKYQYNIDMNKVEVEEDPTIIKSGAPATAYLNQMPELLLDMRVHRKCPLVCSGLECGLMYSVVLPVFYPSQGCCVGVVECSTSSSHKLLQAFNELNSALENEGLITFHARQHLPYKAICGLEHAKDEINEALEIIWQTHGLGFAQVWIAYEDENYVALSSPFEDTRTKRMLGLKLIGRYVALYDEDLEGRHKPLIHYSNACDMIPLKLREGLTGKTFQNYEPHFLKSISRLSDNEPLRLLSPFIECSCFVIYLRSTTTGDLDYVFEFLWSQSRNSIILFESLLLTLKRCLSSFKFVSGVELGDELYILDVDNSTESERKYFKIFQKNKLPLVFDETLKRGRRPYVKKCLKPLKVKCKTTPIPLSQEDIKPQFGKTMMEAAKNLNVSLSTLKRKCKVLGIPEWHGKDYSKRNVNHLYKNQCYSNEEDTGAIQDHPAHNRITYLDHNTLVIKAEYADDMIKFHLPISSATFVAIQKEISKGFKLDPANYKLKYHDEDGDWILLSSDEDMRVCIQKQRNLSSIVRLRLLPRPITYPSHTDSSHLNPMIMN